jgi:undecaprenyl diphosphate synthase
MKSDIPIHVAIIPDGNRRWAKENGLIKTAGHVRAGSYENLKALFDSAKKLGIKYVSFWGFSTENWKREKTEVNQILNVIEKGVDKLLKNVRQEKTRFRHIGRKDRLPKELIEKLERLENESKDFGENFVLLCIDYGGRDEIVRAVNKIIKTAGHLGDVEERTFSNYLDTKGIPDPDLIIRTGGEKRFSGFMPFQSVYSELYFTDVYFPDFDGKELKKAVEEYSNRKRRFGGD